MTVQPPDAARFARISQQLFAGDDPRTVLQTAVDTAVETIEPCDYAGISLRHGKGLIDTPVMTDAIVLTADNLQYELGEGPCLDAIYRDGTDVIDDLRNEQRWPKWAPAAADLGLRGVLSVRLETSERIVGGLNLYSARPYAYTENDVLTGHIYAMHASTAIHQSQDKDGLRLALNTRHEIGMAQGLLMGYFDIDPDGAFQLLRRMSSVHNVKLRELAAAVVDYRGRIGQLPWLDQDARDGKD
jgi:GAF domain-containing protein